MKRTVFVGWTAFFVKLSLIALVATVLSFTLFTLANFSDSVERFSFYVKTNDSDMAKKELVGLHYFYDLSRKWKVQWLADRYLFGDAYFYEVADLYLIHDWDALLNGDLKDRLDDPKAYPYGNAKFRRAQSLYRVGYEKEALELVLTEVAVDYEKALRNCLGAKPYEKCFDRVWNYDLVNNKKNAEEALKNPPPKVPFILGPPKKDGEPILPPPKVPSKNGKEDEKKPGQGGAKKRP